MIGVRIAEDLVNLDADDRWSRDEVVPILHRHLVRFTDEALDAELDSLRDWTCELRAVFEANDAAHRQTLINELLTIAVQHVHLATHDGFPAHLHFVGDEQGLTARVRAATVGGIAIFAVESELGRMGPCSRPGCARVYVDTSRNGRRAYCSPGCGNADAVQRYRERGAARRRAD